MLLPDYMPKLGEYREYEARQVLMILQPEYTFAGPDEVAKVDTEFYLARRGQLACKVIDMMPIHM